LKTKGVSFQPRVAVQRCPPHDARDAGGRWPFWRASLPLRITTRFIRVRLPRAIWWDPIALSWQNQERALCHILWVRSKLMFQEHFRFLRASDVSLPPSLTPPLRQVDIRDVNLERPSLYCTCTCAPRPTKLTEYSRANGRGGFMQENDLQANYERP